MSSAAPSRSGSPVARSSALSTNARAAGDVDERAEREVDDEHPAPVELDQHAAERRAGGGGERGRRAPQRDRGRALRERVLGQDQRERDGHDHGRARALQRAGGDQHLPARAPRRTRPRRR